MTRLLKNALSIKFKISPVGPRVHREPNTLGFPVASSTEQLPVYISELYWIKVLSGARHVCRIEDTHLMIDIGLLHSFSTARCIATSKEALNVRRLLTVIGLTGEGNRAGGGCSVDDGGGGGGDTVKST